MNDHVCWMLEMSVQGGRDHDLKALMAEMVGATKANEPGTLDYEWHLSPNGRTCHLFERYADSAAAMVHIATFGEKYAERFLSVLAPTRLTLYGSPDATVREELAGFGAIPMERVSGFSR